MPRIYSSVKHTGRWLDCVGEDTNHYFKQPRGVQRVKGVSFLPTSSFNSIFKGSFQNHLHCNSKICRMICSNYWTYLKERLGWIFTSKYWMSKQLGWSERLVNKCMWFRFRHILMKIGFIDSLYGNILTSVSSFLNQQSSPADNGSEIPASHWSELPSYPTDCRDCKSGPDTLSPAFSHPWSPYPKHPKMGMQIQDRGFGPGMPASSHNSTTSTVRCSQEG